MFNIIHISPVSVSIELENDNPYFAPEEYDIYLDGEFVRKENRNIASVFGLKPNTVHTIKVGDTQKEFTTLNVEKTVNVMDFGVVADGVTLTTEKIQAVLDNSANCLVVFPEGKYYSGPLEFRSNSFIYLEKGAHILASTNRDDYPVLEPFVEMDGERFVEGSWEGKPGRQFKSIMTIRYAHDVMIVGEGTIDGNGDKADWWIDHRTMRGAWRPNNLYTNRSKNIDLVGINVINSASWNLHPFYSSNINFIDLNINTQYNSPNTDGCDPESCDHINLLGTKICVGDDCVAIKSGKKIMADEFFKPTEYMEIRNCYMGDGHGAVVLGSEASCGINHLTVSKCYFKDTDRGLRIKTKRGRGNHAGASDIKFDNIYMDGVYSCLVVNMYYYLTHDGYDEFSDDKNWRPVDEYTPHIGEFEFKNMKCVNTKVCAGYFYGLPESKIDGVYLKNIDVTYDPSYTEYKNPAMIYECEKLNNAGFYFYNVAKVEHENVNVTGQKGEIFVIK